MSFASANGEKLSDTQLPDLKNHRILRLITVATAESAKFTEPFVTLRQEFNYQPSVFEIHLPRKIVSEHFIPLADKDVKLQFKNGKSKLRSSAANMINNGIQKFQ